MAITGSFEPLTAAVGVVGGVPSCGNGGAAAAVGEKVPGGGDLGLPPPPVSGGREGWGRFRVAPAAGRSLKQPSPSTSERGSACAGIPPPVLAPVCDAPSPAIAQPSSSFWPMRPPTLSVRYCTSVCANIPFWPEKRAGWK